MNPRPRSRTRLAAALLAALALAGGACGGDDDDVTATPPDTVDEVADEQQEEPVEDEAAEGEAAPDAGGGTPPPADRCPFTAEELTTATAESWVLLGSFEDELEEGRAFICDWGSEETDSEGDPVLGMRTNTVVGEVARLAEQSFVETCEEAGGEIRVSRAHPGARWCDEDGYVDHGMVERGGTIVLVGLYADEEERLADLIEDILGLV